MHFAMHVQQYVANLSFEQFSKDQKTIDAVIRNFIILGEAAQRIPPDIATKYSSIPWRLIGDMRNFAVHEYWGVEPIVLWKTIKEDLPPLVPHLREILSKEQE